MQVDPYFMYFVFSILQRRAVNVQSMLTMKKSNYDAAFQSLSQINTVVLDKFLTKLDGANYISNPSAEDKSLFRVMRLIETVSSKVKGSLQSKKSMRSMIHSIIR